MYYAIIDEEFCNVAYGARSSKYYLKNEIIQIGVVLLNEAYEEVDRFSSYVCPKFGHVDAFIRKLTGIDQYTASQGDYLENVLERLKDWMPEDTVMVSWSLSDLHQLRKECEMKEIDTGWLQDKYDTWQDCQAEFSKKVKGIKNKQYNLEEALCMSDVDISGNCHDGMDDAYNTAQLFRKMRLEPEFKASRKYLKADEESEGITFSLGSLLSNIVLAS